MWYDGVLRIDGLRIEGWQADATWSWALSASTTDVTDAHWVDNVHIVAGELGSVRGRLPLEVSTNGQQFSQAGLYYRYEPLASLACDRRDRLR